MSCGFNMNIKGVGNINSPENSDGNVMKLFNTNQRINHCHGRRKYHPPKITTLFSRRDRMLKSLRDFALQKPYMLALMGLLSNISGLVVSFAMRPNFDFLNQFGRYCYHKLLSSS
jgi:hypothetical protein